MLNTLKVLPRIMQSSQKASILTSVSHLACSNSLFHQNIYGFSKFFQELDDKEMTAYSSKKYQNKKYRDLVDLWKKPLQKKKRRQQRIVQIKAALPEVKIQGQKLVVHNSAVGIKYPPTKDQIFCVVKLDGFQYKVTQDCVLVLDTKQTHEINQTIKFSQVLIAGTPTYTVLGRPSLTDTYVEGVIESISNSEKTVVFKKKRRKQYKRSFGSRVSLTTCRIIKIVHTLSTQTLERAVNLIETDKQQQAQK